MPLHQRSQGYLNMSCTDRGTVGSDVFCVVRPKVYNEDEWEKSLVGNHESQDGSSRSELAVRVLGCIVIRHVRTAVRGGKGWIDYIGTNMIAHSSGRGRYNCHTGTAVQPTIDNSWY
jgi:hypothetical protein